MTSNADLVDKQVDGIASPERINGVNEETESNGSENQIGEEIGMHNSSPGFLHDGMTMTEKNALEIEHKFQSYLTSFDSIG